MTAPSDPSRPFSSIKIISGGQTGADRAGLDVAIACGIPHGGWCPNGRKSEDGPLPERYLLTETPSASYLVRTERNAAESDATVIFTLGALSGGSKRTADFAKNMADRFCRSSSWVARKPRPPSVLPRLSVFTVSPASMSRVPAKAMSRASTPGHSKCWGSHLIC